jgi:hypothetical protein
MAKHHRRRHQRRHNPFRSYSRGRHNPLGFSGDIFVEAAWGVAGGVVANMVPARFLPGYNTGWAGVGASLVTTIAASWAANKFMGSRAGTGVAIGGLITTMGRAIKTAMPGTSLLGNYVASDFTAPTTSDLYGRYQWPYKAALAQLAAARGMAGLRGQSAHRFASRFDMGGR